MTLLKITKSNYLVEACYTLSLQEQRLLLSCLSKVDPRSSIDKHVTITALEYSRLMGISHKNAHRELDKAAKKLFDRSIIIRREGRTEELRWIQKRTVYHRGEGKVTLIWSDEICNYISQLKKRFTSYRLHYVSKFKTVYALRFYELLVQFMSTNERVISLNDLRSFLNIEGKYLLFRDLNQKVIKPSIAEINRHSNLQVFYSTIKQGRTAISLVFDFDEKEEKVFSSDERLCLNTKDMFEDA